MNPFPDSFEWKIMRTSVVALCWFFIVAVMVAIVSQLLPGQIRYPQGDLIFASRILGLAASLIALVLVARLHENSGLLAILALGVLGTNFVASMGTLFWSQGNLIVHQASFLLISTVYLFLFGFFSRRQWLTVLFGFLLCVLAWWVFVLTPEVWFRQIFSPEQLAQSLTFLLFFGIPVVTFLVFINNQVATTLMTRVQATSAKLSRLAYYDGETGLANGIQLEKDLDGWKTETLSPGHRVVLAGFRLEGLDALNERQGLEATTASLQRIAQSYHKQLTRGLDSNPSYRGPAGWQTMYRIEGATFVFPFVVPPQTRPDTSPMEVLLDSVMRDELTLLPPGSHIRFHGGFTVYPDDTAMPRQLVRNLLNLLHSGGKLVSGEFVPFNVDQYREFVRAESVKAQLGPALENGEFFVAFQPKVRLSDEAVVGFEALSRWTSPSLGVVSPGEFIPLAERSDLMKRLTESVLEGSAQLIRGLAARGRHDQRISINLSPGLLETSFLRKLANRLEVQDLARYLEFEITEGTLMVLDQEIRDQIHQLRTLGVAFSIDDFGTGYSNLGYLQNFEAEVLKVDKRFIDGIPHNEKSVKLVQAILQMARSFGMKVVAEGVEFQEQRDLLAGFGCDQIQGYFYSKPLRPEEALEFISTRRGEPAPSGE